MGSKKLLDQAEKVRQDRVRDVEELEKEGRQMMVPPQAVRRNKNIEELQELVAEAQINT
jgi:hypothetical protein